MVTRKTNRGMQIDMDSLISASESSSPSLGNMRVNAKGDVLGPGGEIVQKNEDRVRAYYKNNPKSSTTSASLKGPQPKLKPDNVEPAKPSITKEQQEKFREDGRKRAAAKTVSIPRTEDKPVDEPDEFAPPEDQEPLGYNELELPNGDIKMVPYFREEDKT